MNREELQLLTLEPAGGSAACKVIRAFELLFPNCSVSLSPNRLIPRHVEDGPKDLSQRLQLREKCF